MREGPGYPAGLLERGKQFNPSQKPLRSLTNNCGDEEIDSPGAGWKIGKLHTGGLLEREGSEEGSKSFQRQQFPSVKYTPEQELQTHVLHEV